MKKHPEGNLFGRLSAEEETIEIRQLASKVRQLQNQLKISDRIAQDVKERIEDSFEKAQSSIQLIGGSEDDLAKIWGYNFGAVLYEYLSQRDSDESRQALSFIKMQLGFELNTKIGSELQFSSFVLGMGLRFMKGFEKLKENLIALEDALNRFENREYMHDESNESTGKDLFGREQSHSD
ncbi:MAG: hypothetical protein ACFFE8_08515 [Candidatus Heimdallarchaeota archaeon]